MKVQLIFTLVFICASLQTAPANSVGESKTITFANDKTFGESVSAGFKEVTKAKFKEYFFRYGVSVKNSGWTAEYWEEVFEKNAKPGFKFMLEEPKSASHNRLNIVTDNNAKEYRMYFMTEDDDGDVSVR